MSNNFNIDKETYADLNLIHSQELTIFDCFNRATTVGGADKLKEFFLDPTTSIVEIVQRQKRVAIMENLALPTFDNSVLKELHAYLNQGERSAAGFVVSAIRNLFSVYSPSYYYRKRYILELNALLSVLATFVHTNAAIFQEMGLIDQEFVQKCRQKIPKKSINFYNLNQFEQVIKVVLRKDLLELINSIYLLDAYRAIALVKKEKNLHFPSFKPAGSSTGIDIRGLFHLFTENAVHNNVVLEKKENVWFLTGANMAGKSTLIKSLGVAVYLAHIGFPVPARAMHLEVLTGLFTSMTINDKILLGYSHFFNEVHRLKSITEQLDNRAPAFVIIDELFKGTNYQDAYNGIYEDVQLFSKCNSFVIISSHLTELSTKIEENLPAVKFMRLTTEIKDEQAIYTYKLQQGVANERLGMWIIKQSGLLNTFD